MVRSVKQKASQKKASLASAAKRKIAPKAVRKKTYDPLHVDRVTRKTYNLGGMNIGDMRRARSMAPPPGIAADLHKAVLDLAIVRAQNDRTYKRSMKERGAW